MLNLKPQEFRPADTVTVSRGKTVWTVLETYRDNLGLCLVLAADASRRVALAVDCRAVSSPVSAP